MDDTNRLDDVLARLARIEDAIARIASQMHTLANAYNQGLQETFFSQSAYLGDHRALTRLRSGQLVFVDTRSVDIGSHLLFGGHWEANYVAAFERLLKPGHVVVDIGANHGVYALLAAAKVAPDGHVYAFEGSARFCELLRASISVNGLDRSITLEHRAVADGGYETTLIADAQMSGAGHIAPAGAGEAPPASPPGVGSYPVRCVALDDYFSDPAQRIDAIKMDIEGAEGLALKGMARLVDRSPTVKIMMEFAPHLMARYPCDAAFVVDFFESRRFMCWTIGPDASLAPARWEALLEGESVIRNVIAARQMP